MRDERMKASTDHESRGNRHSTYARLETRRSSGLLQRVWAEEGGMLQITHANATSQIRGVASAVKVSQAHLVDQPATFFFSARRLSFLLRESRDTLRILPYDFMKRRW
eukprot:CAMPEP_0183350044 /NCGR_PEP_ID=MMETSP0164_2-20130417/15887_1 /TAXON_ID=221442 /ORGANISM="Coccolithus pelagicus ssp braarudi, Strain PLY182g" /LENGTH=107 /DNA_ID=CAMNT_0025521891 /DNA_START=67 /DNA_END=387 /DNA_ORIENTATION=+